MPSITGSILYDNYDRTVVSFVWGGGAATAYGITGVVQASSLTCYDSTQAVNSSNVNINLSKVFWSLPQGSTATAIEVAWGVSGSVTGTPFLYLNGGGYVNYVSDGMSFKNGSTAADRRNYIQIRNTAAVSAADTFTVILELDKNGGYLRTNTSL
jgi:hypothetical protein